MLVESCGNLTLGGDIYRRCLVFIVVDISFQRCGHGQLICF